MRVYGPYYRKDGRQHVIIVDDEGKKRTISYPKFLLEQHIGRKLLPAETVDHIDRDFKNNSISNLRIIDRSKHAKEDAKRVRLVSFICVWCGQNAERKANQLHHNANMLKAGPFCSKVCSGKYGASLQNGQIDALKPQPKVPVEEREYYYHEKKL